MEKIENVFLELDSYNCYGCSPVNDKGLHLKFFVDKEKEEVVSYYSADEIYAGFPEILHGGIQATLLDEIAFWVMFAFMKKMGFTTDMNIKFKRPVKTGEKLEIRGRITESSSKHAKIYGYILNREKKICTEAEVVYVIVNKELWMRNLGVRDLPDTFKGYFR